VFNFTFNGAQIYLCHAQHETDIQTYLGAEIHVLLVDEATQFTEKMVRFLRTRVRLGGLILPAKWAKLLPKIIYGTNPGGISHSYFKKGFVSHGERSVFKAPANDGGMTREFIPALSTDNIIMLKNDPRYGDRIRGIGDDRLANAYLHGSWDLDEGNAFSDLWDPHFHIVQNLSLPRHWKIDRCHDYGYSAPAAMLHAAESDGTKVVINDKEMIIPRKSIIFISELYLADKEDKGLKLLPYELGLRMYNHEVGQGYRNLVQAGPADSSIFDKDKGMASIHDYYVQKGVRFTRADKRPGSRERGYVLWRQGLKAALERNVEQPWILVHRSCSNLISQIPELPVDPENPQDVYSSANDHLYDAGRYRLLKSVLTAEMNEVYGT
jgi:hypothetical protein